MTSLDGLRALEQAASPAPWRAPDDHWIFDAEGHAVFAGSMLIPDEAAFVVAARNALPGLLGRVEAAEAERDRAEERLREVAVLLRIPDGARYLNDVRERAEVVGRAEAERDALREALDLARAVKFEHHAVHEMRLGEDCVICAKPWVRAKLDRIAVLVASVPSGPAAGPTTSKETR